MNKEINNYFIKTLNNRKGIPLNKKEILYVNNQLNRIPREKFTKTSIPLLVNILYDDIKNNHYNIYGEYSEVDIHEILNKEIKENKKQNDDIVINNSNNIIDKFLGVSDLNNLMKQLNSKHSIKKAYMLLDRRYQSGTTDNSKLFSWDLSFKGNAAGGPNIIYSHFPITNIVGMKMYPFKFPDALTDEPFSMKRLSVTIDELLTQSYNTSGSKGKFHFLFGVVDNAPVTIDRYHISEISTDANEIEFIQSIQHIDTITISFGNPLIKIPLSTDNLLATITNTAPTTTLTFTTPHNIEIDEIIIIERFTTTNPGIDKSIIETINNEFGHKVTAKTVTTVEIDVDISLLTGVIIAPTKIYFESKRFMIPLEIFFKEEEF